MRRGDCSVGKKSRKFMTLAENIVIFEELRGGMSVASVGHENHVNESTARIIHSSEDKIHASVKTSTPGGAKVSQVPRRNHLIENIERLMSVFAMRAYCISFLNP
uniref:HTH psq-type domain-containing protein n=1 Tax=Eptatretus burgeri TaxID=7764 RepID=A0A8C4WPW4_EPTBU